MSRSPLLAGLLLGLGCFSESDDIHASGEEAGSTGGTGSTSGSSGTSTGGPTGEEATATSSPTTTVDTTSGGSGCTPGATHRMQITVQQDEMFEQVPLLVRLTPDRFDYGSATEDGADVRFFGDACEPLAHEIETWNVAGVSDIWVGFPTLNPGETFWLETGDSDSPTPPARNVWSAYLGVWHLSDDIVGESIVHDSAGSNLDGTPQGAAPAITQVGDGIAGHAMAFTGMDIVIPDNDLLDIESSVTVEAWARLVQVSASNQDRFALRRITDTDVDPYWLAIETTISSTPAFGVDPKGADAAVSVVGTASLEIGTWTYLAATAELGMEMRLYQDAMIPSLGPMVNVGPDVGTELHLGTNLDAELDEVRLMAGAPPRAWFQLQHASLLDNLLVYGPLESMG